MEEIIKKAETLVEALPYIRTFRHKTAVIKFGGSILADDRIRHLVLEDIVFLSFVGLRPILVHGGGSNITERMRELGKKTEFFEGMRMTDKETLQVVSEELQKLNRQLVKEINLLEGLSVGLSGEKEGIIQVKKKEGRKDLGFVGEIVKIGRGPIEEHLRGGRIPVISPMGKGRDRHLYNVNADEAAAAIASNLSAEKFVLLTNVKGIMRDQADEVSLISSLTIEEARRLIEEGVIQEGMIPKIRACIRALEGGTKKTHIIDARLPHALLLEIFTDKGIGTEIVK